MLYVSRAFGLGYLWLGNSSKKTSFETFNKANIEVYILIAITFFLLHWGGASDILCQSKSNNLYKISIFSQGEYTKYRDMLNERQRELDELRHKLTEFDINNQQLQDQNSEQAAMLSDLKKQLDLKEKSY